MKEGEITDVIEEKDKVGRDLFKIILLKKSIPEHSMNFDTDYPKIKEMTLDEKKNKVLVKWMNQKIKNNYIKINTDFQKCDFKSNWIKK